MTEKEKIEKMRKIMLKSKKYKKELKVINSFSFVIEKRIKR